jgi:hypothetical protein
MNLNQINESLTRIAKVLSEGVAEEIYKQIGKRAFYMMGAKNIAKGKDGSTEYLQFQIGRNPKGVNIVRVEYDYGRDLYNIIFYNLRGTNLKIKSRVDGAYADMLHDVLKNHTGMALSL